MARIPVDFGDADAELAAAQDYAARLPVDTSNIGYTHTYKPGWDADLVAQAEAERNPLVFAPAIREGFTTAGQLVSGEKNFVSPSEMGNRLLGKGWILGPNGIPIPNLSDENRVQTWPEQMVRSGFSLAHDVKSGELPVWDGEHTNLELIHRTQDLAGMAGGRFAAKPNAVIAAAKSSELAPLAALEHAPRFYSAVEHAVNNSKTKVANAEQWLGELRNQPGVKQEELDWVLHDLPEGKITKSELEQFVKEHKVELKEVNKGDLGEQWRLSYKDGSGTFQRFATRAEAEEAIKSINAEDRLEVKPFIDNTPTKYSQWQLPGGENYREHLLTLPTRYGRSEGAWREYINELNEKYGENFYNSGKLKPEEKAKLNKLHREAGYGAGDPQNNFQSTHWSEPNVLAHVRTNERVIPPVAGGRNQPLNSLHIEEIQSDWHQKGRSHGYAGELDKLAPEFTRIDKKLMDTGDEHILADPELNNALQKAVDKKIITKQEADLYKRYTKIEANSAADNNWVPDAPFKSNWADLALKRIIRQAAEEGKDSISWTPGEAQAARYDLSKQIHALHVVKTDKGWLIAPEKLNREEFPINNGQAIQANKLADYVGKDLADKIINNEKYHDGKLHTLEGIDLKIGGEGMKAFYDKMLVDKANAIAKKFGGKVEQSEISPHKFEIVETSDGPIGRFDVMRDGKQYYSSVTRKTAEEYVARHKPQPIHILRITPQLRDAALNKGFSLFADTGKVGAPIAALTRVEHNPFKLAELEKQHNVKLTPVAENPFTATSFHGSPNPLRGEKIENSARYAIKPLDNDTFHIWDKVDNKIISPEFETKSAAKEWMDKRIGVEFYSTPNPHLASDYALQNFINPEYSKGTNVLPLRLDTRNYHTVDARGKTWDEVNTFAINEANQLKKKGVIIKNVLDDSNPEHQTRGRQTVYITLDPSTVRSRFAKFDPAKFGESGLLKASGLPIYSDEHGNQLMPSPTNPARIPALEPDPHVATIGAAKAAEWLAFLKSRNYPKINGPLMAAWIAQWPMLSVMLKNNIDKQLKAGKKPNEIEFDEGSVGDMLGLISTLKKKYGKKADSLVPIEGNPFEKY